MMDDWEVLALLAGMAVFVAHRILENGLHEQIPLSDPSTSVGAGLALLAIAGVALNSYVYAET